MLEMNSEIKNTLTSQVYLDLVEKIENFELAPYLQEEAKKVLAYFSVYKLENITKNIDFFFNYLALINQKNTELITSLLKNLEWREDLELVDSWVLKYYLSTIEECDEKLKIKNIKNTEVFVSLVSGMKGYLVLTLDEFCHASHTRIEINRLLFAKEMRGKKINS